jgi:light-regulated signal transduction histidine kinase (bacteriophytochrome)
VGEPGHLVSLFQNLVGNAVKFRAEGRRPRVEVGGRRQDGTCLFWVADNGIGIEAQYADRIFNVFQRLHGRNEYAGTGIGLAICKRVVERAGGRLWFESKPGEGSTFFWTMPSG